MLLPVRPLKMRETVYVASSLVYTQDNNVYMNKCEYVGVPVLQIKAWGTVECEMECNGSGSYRPEVGDQMVH
jgi:hypothetical protein